ncbi:hypothetical protein MNV49_006177 [Pseudohyphozyma bogoriensis]|nr:hypothetical protein MNV49_006177 [Pseudohyphozyma bogoriensis]
MTVLSPAFLPEGSPSSMRAADARAELFAKLPKALVLSPETIAQYPLGSDVSKVPETCGLLTPEQIAITNKDATELVELLAAGKLSSVEVTMAFGYRAAIAQQLTSCLTDYFLDEALVKAKELDDYLKNTGKTVGPLHGLPVSLKDQLQITGKLSSISFLSLHTQKNVSTADAQLVRILAAAGAVFYVKTNLPQTIMHLESESFWGATLCPYNTGLSAGGSSGGEGALLGMRGSVLGVGSDIGGSIRSPAANNGLYGLRPTAQRIPNTGSKSFSAGRDSILGVVGPLAHTLRDIDLFMNTVLTAEASQPWLEDPALFEMPWGEGRKGAWESGKRKLRVGIMGCDGEVTPTKPVKRAFDAAVEKLKKDGSVEVVEFEPYKTREGWEIIRQLYFSDAGRRYHQLLDESDVAEPWHPLTAWLVHEAGPKLEPVTDMHALWELNIKRDYFRVGFTKHWNESGIDVLLTPASAQPASPHREAKWWAYTSQWNLVDHPAIAFPSGLFVETELDAATEAHKPLSKDDEYLHNMYNSKTYEGAPIALQLVARKFHDEELVAALGKIQTIIA